MACARGPDFHTNVESPPHTPKPPQSYETRNVVLDSTATRDNVAEVIHAVVAINPVQ